jgi:hypothetical protein
VQAELPLSYVQELRRLQIAVREFEHGSVDRCPAPVITAKIAWQLHRNCNASSCCTGMLYDMLVTMKLALRIFPAGRTLWWHRHRKLLAQVCGA